MNNRKKRTGQKIVKTTATAALCFCCGYAGVRVGALSVMQSNDTTESTSSTSSTTSTVYNLASTDESELSGTEVAAKISPSVVAITTEQVVTSQSWYGSYVSSGAGSGVIITSDGYILTCAHVIEGADTITVTLEDGTEYTAEVVGSDTADDIAVIKIDATDLTAAEIGDSDSAEVGETVYADGNPNGTLSGTITSGILSALNREITVEVSDGVTSTLTVLQTSAAVSPGNSGGGLFNAKGQLIGIVNAKSSSEDSEGLGFAIPINTAMEIANDIINNGAYAVSESDSGNSETGNPYSGNGQYGFGGMFGGLGF